MLQVGAAQIAASLRLVADELEAGDPYSRLKPELRRRALRYAPFLRELSCRAEFCDALSTLPMSGIEDETPESYVLSLPWPLLDRFKFPDGAPYRRQEWARLLVDVAERAVGRDVPTFPWSFFPLPDHYEIQFVYHGTHGQVSRGETPIVNAREISLLTGMSKDYAVTYLKAQLRETLKSFLGRIRHLSAGLDNRRFTIRLMKGKPNTDGWNENESICADAIARPSRVHETTILHEVARTVLSRLEEKKLVVTATRKGRPPHTDRVARWWAMRVFDGMSPDDIAERQEADSDAAQDLVETIARELRALG